MTRKILTTTGFLLPPNDLFEVYKSNTTQFDAFVGRDNNYDFKHLSQYYVDNAILHSPHAMGLYTKYRADSSYNNFIDLVDFTAMALQGVDCRTFVEWQAYSRHTPDITLMLLKDLLGKRLTNLHQYSHLSAQTRFVLNTSITKDAALRRYQNVIDKVPANQMSWVNVLEPLMQDKSMFVTLFRYLFVSSF